MSQNLPEIESVEVQGKGLGVKTTVTVEYRTTIPVFQKFRSDGFGAKETLESRGIVAETRYASYQPEVAALEAIGEYLEALRGELDLREVDPELFELVQNG